MEFEQMQDPGIIKRVVERLKLLHSGGYAVQESNQLLVGVRYGKTLSVKHGLRQASNRVQAFKMGGQGSSFS